VQCDFPICEQVLMTICYLKLVMRDFKSDLIKLLAMSDFLSIFLNWQVFSWCHLWIFLKEFVDEYY
jgi:hypothetical protein